MRFFIFLILFLVGGLIAKEPSAFESQSGATKKELETLKKDMSSYTDKVIDIERQIRQLNTSFEGLNSVHSSQSNKLKEVVDSITSINYYYYHLNKDIIELKARIDTQDKHIKLLGENLNNIKDSISQIRDMLSDIRNNTSIDEKDSKKDNKDTNETSTKSSFIKDVNKAAVIFKEARSLTYNNKFEDAIDRYKWLSEINYKKAESVYMLGNIAYARNKYNDALFYYKESATLDDKAKYMPRLLLNTANSFRVLNNMDNAKKFYNSLLSLFPNSEESKEANKYLNKLK